MKRIKATLIAGFFSIFAITAFANINMVNTQEAIIQTTDKSSVSVEVENLPQPVKDALQEDKYSEWNATRASLVTSADKSYYQVTISKDGETKTVYVTPEGEVKEKDKDKDKERK